MNVTGLFFMDHVVYNCLIFSVFSELAIVQRPSVKLSFSLSLYEMKLAVIASMYKKPVDGAAMVLPDSLSTAASVIIHKHCTAMSIHPLQYYTRSIARSV